MSLPQFEPLKIRLPMGNFLLEFERARLVRLTRQHKAPGGWQQHVFIFKELRRAWVYSRGEIDGKSTAALDLLAAYLLPEFQKWADKHPRLFQTIAKMEQHPKTR